MDKIISIFLSLSVLLFLNTYNCKRVVCSYKYLLTESFARTQWLPLVYYVWSLLAYLNFTLLTYQRGRGDPPQSLARAASDLGRLALLKMWYPDHAQDTEIHCNVFMHNMSKQDDLRS